MYRQIFKVFECARESDGDDDSEMSISDIVAAAKANMLECNETMNETESCDPLKEYLASEILDINEQTTDHSRVFGTGFREQHQMVIRCYCNIEVTETKCGVDS